METSLHQDQPEKDNEGLSKDEKRKETNKTDPQLTELKGFTDPEEPLEEEGTLNPFTGNVKEGQ